MSESSKSYQFSISGNTVTAVYEVKHGRVKFERMDNDETWSFNGVNVTKTEWDDGRQEVTTYTDYDGDGLYSKAGKSYTGSSFASTYDYDNHDDDDHDSHDNDHGYGYDDDGADDHDYGYNDDSVDDHDHGYNDDSADDHDSDHGIQSSVFTSSSYNWSPSFETDTDDTFQNDLKLDVNSGTFFQSPEEFRFTLSNGSLATGNLVSEADNITRMMELERWGWKTDYLNFNETLQVVDTGSDSLILKTQTRWNGELEFSVYRDDDNDGMWNEIAEGSTRESFVTTDGQVDLLGMANAGLLQLGNAFIQ